MWTRHSPEYTQVHEFEDGRTRKRLPHTDNGAGKVIMKGMVIWDHTYMAINTPHEGQIQVLTTESIGYWDRGIETRSGHGCLSSSSCSVLFVITLEVFNKVPVYTN